jgi:hypothetical protein
MRPGPALARIDACGPGGSILSLVLVVLRLIIPMIIRTIQAVPSGLDSISQL